MGWSCYLGNPDCMQQADQIFQAWKQAEDFEDRLALHQGGIIFNKDKSDVALKAIIGTAESVCICFLQLYSYKF